MSIACLQHRFPFRTIAALALLLFSTFRTQAGSSRPIPLIVHDTAASPQPSNSDAEHLHTYLDSSGILFLSASTLAEYVLRAPENNLLVRNGRQVTNRYLLTISLFDVEKNRIIAHSDLPVPGRFLRVFRSAQDGLLLVTHSWVAALSPALETVHQVPISPRFGDADVASDTDIDGAHLYLAAESNDGCTQLVQQIDSASLTVENSWCLQSAAPAAFFRTTALQYSHDAGADISVLRDGHFFTHLKPPSAFATTQAIPLSDNTFLLTNGSALLDYQLDAGLDFLSSPAKHGVIVSPIHCDVTASICAMALAIPKADPLVLSLTTTYKRVDLVTFDAASGHLHSRQSILTLFKRPAQININDFSDLRVVLAPHGEYAAAWRGSTWVVFNTH